MCGSMVRVNQSVISGDNRVITDSIGIKQLREQGCVVGGVVRGVVRDVARILPLSLFVLHETLSYRHGVDKRIP